MAAPILSRRLGRCPVAPCAAPDERGALQRIGSCISTTWVTHLAVRAEARPGPSLTIERRRTASAGDGAADVAFRVERVSRPRPDVAVRVSGRREIANARDPQRPRETPSASALEGTLLGAQTPSASPAALALLGVPRAAGLRVFAVHASTTTPRGCTVAAFSDDFPLALFLTAPVATAQLVPVARGLHRIGGTRSVTTAAEATASGTTTARATPRRRCASWALFSRVDVQGASAEVRAIELLDACGGLLVVGERDEGEASRPPCLAVRGKKGIHDFPGSREEPDEVLLGGRVVEVAYEYLCGNGPAPVPSP